MKNRFKQVAFSIVFVLLLVSLAACSAKDKDVTLVFYNEYAPNSPEEKFFQDEIKKFEEQNPGITIKSVGTPGQDFNKAFTAAVTAKQDIDVIEINAQFMRNYSSKGLLKDITDSWKNMDWRTPIAWEQVKYLAGEDKIYGVPFTINSTAIYYNKDVFSKYKLEVPKTWAEVENMVSVLKADRITPLVYAGAEAWWNPMHFNAFFYQETGNKGLEINDKFMKGDYSPEVLGYYEKALQDLRDLVTKGILPEDIQSLKLDQATKLLVDGKAAMYFQGDWFGASIIAAKADGHIGLMEFPVLKEGLKPQNGGSIGGIYSVYAKSKHPEEALKFVEFISSQAVSEDKEKANVSGGEPLFPGVKAGTPYAQWFVDNAQANTVVWLDAIWEQPIISEFQQGIGAVISGKVTPQEQMQVIVNKYKQLREQGQTYN